MNKMKNWVHVIQVFFSNDKSDGISLSWDRRRFFDNFEKSLAPYEVINNTDFNYSYCNSFDLRVPETIIEGSYIITLKLSFVVNAFVLFVTWYSPDFRRGRVVSVDDLPQLSKLYEKVRHFAVANGFDEVPDSWLEIPIENVQLQLASVPNLDNCLFDDF